jgi:hypothetical protein
MLFCCQTWKRHTKLLNLIKIHSHQCRSRLLDSASTNGFQDRTAFTCHSHVIHMSQRLDQPSGSSHEKCGSKCRDPVGYRVLESLQIPCDRPLDPRTTAFVGQPFLTRACFSRHSILYRCATLRFEQVRQISVTSKAARVATLTRASRRIHHQNHQENFDARCSAGSNGTVSQNRFPKH